MHEADSWPLFGELFKRKSGLCSSVAGGFDGREIVFYFEVVKIDGFFLAAGKDRYYTGIRGGLEKWKEVVSEAETGVVAKSMGDVDSFGRF